ncbi:MAG: hypothetical protein LKE30_04645 [Bacteroidales bacterium]|jgi:uncharacterized Tic20 family protein|nr:hypothetical protein [Bacteroidales bacterium]
MKDLLNPLKGRNELFIRPNSLDEKSKNVRNLKYCAKVILIAGIILFITCMCLIDDMSNFEENTIIIFGFVILLTNIVLYFLLNVIADISDSLNNKNKKS